MKKLEHWCSVGGNVKWCSHYEKTMWWFLKKKLKTEPPYDPAKPIQGVHPEELKAGSQRVICTPVFRAVLFTVAKR